MGEAKHHVHPGGPAARRAGIVPAAAPLQVPGRFLAPRAVTPFQPVGADRREGPEFKGQTGQGDWADALLELDTDFGALLDLLDGLGIADNTVVVFAGDNGPEDILLWRGTPGYWEGS